MNKERIIMILQLKGFLLLASFFASIPGFNSSLAAQQNKVPARTEKRIEAKTENRRSVKHRKREKAKTEDTRLKADTSQRQKALTEPKVMYKK